MNAAIRRLIHDLDCLPAGGGLEELFRAVKANRIAASDVAEHVRFDPAHYHRESVVKTDTYQMLALAWLPGQRSPIHNHRGSQCCVRVLRGTAVETVFTPTRDGFFETRIDRHDAGSVLGGEDADIHVVENAASADIGLVTMHIYRPALTRMELFEVRNNRLVVVSPTISRLSSTSR